MVLWTCTDIINANIATNTTNTKDTTGTKNTTGTSNTDHANIGVLGLGFFFVEEARMQGRKQGARKNSKEARRTARNPHQQLPLFQ